MFCGTWQSSANCSSYSIWMWGIFCIIVSIAQKQCWIWVMLWCRRLDLQNTRISTGYTPKYSRSLGWRLHIMPSTSFNVVKTTYFWQSFASFWHMTHKINMHSHWHAQLRIWRVLWLCKHKKHMSINTLEMRTTCTTRHVTSRWQFRRKCRCQMT